MTLMDRLTHAEVNKIKGGKAKIEGNLNIKISNYK